MHLWLRLPDEARSLPPPPLFSFVSVWMAFVGWSGALIENGLNRRPILAAGVHRQILWASVGFYIGHYLVKRSNYAFAKRDREISEYIRHHPEDFVKQEKKTMAEVLEDFYPVR
ncbi:NADH dehydrogenase [ubiquinone] 1 subunit C2 [Varanus komodoensis]|uniref:NADH dehydrogenase [ubiquinone] 1 subunit C2 n=1 Tax=Varanus komodoensis TaxID=61221 RepID=A0A8D2J737_VARKO|nr:NADH dehydrogenase [ubiquinone] 1 subunit C2-like [Varanus komodoensis]KAF7237903.1 NADH dehydrogenase [ubiquinone] 1 subunit C2 [Varanus komodoensis]